MEGFRPQILCSATREATAMRNVGVATRESPQAATKTQHSQKTKTERRGIDGSRREAKKVCEQGGRGWEAAGQKELGQCQ